MCVGMLRYALRVCNVMPWTRGFELNETGVCRLRVLLKDVCGLGSGCV